MRKAVTWSLHGIRWRVDVQTLEILHYVIEVDRACLGCLKLLRQ